MLKLNRLPLLHKFLILAGIAVLMSVLPSYLHVRDALRNIDTAQLQASGAAPLQAISQVVQNMQKHRGLSSGMLGGDEGMAPTRAQVAQAIDQGIANATQRLAETAAGRSQQAAWEQARLTWQTLQAEVAQRSVQQAESTARHTALIATIFAISEALMHAHALQVEAEPQHYALIQAALLSTPMLGEKMGILRAQGTGILARGELPGKQWGTVQALVQRAQELQAESQRDYRRALPHPGFASLQAGVQAIDQRISATLELANREVLQASTFSLAPQSYFDTFTETIDALYALNTQAMAQLDQALHQRRAAARQDLLVQAAVFAIILVLSAVLMRAFVRSITGPLNQAVGLARAVAQGDLSGADQEQGSDEVSHLLRVLQEMRSQLIGVVAQVRENADGVAMASAEIAQGNHDLSLRTERQAGALEATASAMEEMTATVHQNAESAHQASDLAASASKVAVQSGDVVAKMVQTMEAIDSASRKIADITGIIDSIAFQTNILALNAAVEAARAGESGRGFAVVAGEVRALAARSASAAREIKTLIDASVGTVREGSVLAEKAGSAIDQVVVSVRRVDDIMRDIRNASREQSQGVGEVGEAIQQMDQGTQQNAALVEEMAAAAASLNSQAQALAQGVQVFRLR